MRKLTIVVFILSCILGATGCTAKNEIRWEYTPEMSSRYPAMCFSFDTPHQKVTAACDNGTLIDFDHFDDIIQGYPHGKSLTIQNADSFYWGPWDNEECLDAVSAKVTFQIFDESGTMLHKGHLKISQDKESPLGAIYSAKLEGNSGWILAQDEYQQGGILREMK